MKHIYILLVLTALSIYSAKAQTYKLIITKNDGTTIEMKTSEVEQMHFEEYTEEEPKEDTLSAENIEKAHELLNGEIVLNSTLCMGTVNKTLLDTGCPTKFKFYWIDDQSFNLSLNNLLMGNMPTTINFICNAKIMVLNSWEQDEYTGDGWIKFQGNNGEVTTNDTDTDSQRTSNDAYMQGYFNVNTNQIEFIISYNVMNIRTNVFLQTIDKDRINHYEEEMKQYEKDLEQWKKDHGLY